VNFKVVNISGNPINLRDTSKWVGVIGPRKASPKELNAARGLVIRLVLKGYVVVSGLALGIDAIAHETCLEVNGYTVAIVSTPINEGIYPERNIQLATKIRQKGTIIHPFSTPTRQSSNEKPSHFSKRLLERNVLLAYLCPVIVAVTDNEIITGGTRYAVKYGLEFNKKVFRLDSRGNWYSSLQYEECQINWPMELDLSKFQ
jgi:predicted Rossmann fold nucleotide-binding protein DprA/Smf involved in DNA uptake